MTHLAHIKTITRGVAGGQWPILTQYGNQRLTLNLPYIKACLDHLNYMITTAARGLLWCDWHEGDRVDQHWRGALVVGQSLLDHSSQIRVSLECKLVIDIVQYFLCNIAKRRVPARRTFIKSRHLAIFKIRPESKLTTHVGT